MAASISTIFNTLYVLKAITQKINKRIEYKEPKNNPKICNYLSKIEKKSEVVIAVSIYFKALIINIDEVKIDAKQVIPIEMLISL